jgi:uncharacterized protein (DUF58 family)
VQLEWIELFLIAGGCFVALVIALVLTIGRTSLEIELSLEPQRVEAGEQSVGRVAATNVGTRRVLPVRLEAPVAKGIARFDVPSLAAGDTWDEIFVIPTERRGIVPVGPVSSMRGDPLGLARRALAWADPIDLYVHPKTVRLAGLTAGWIRDLEGHTTNDLSPSDVAFHTLREYVPGDDRRHVHWRTSARQGRLMVRQFVDTRRTHLGLILSTATTDYADEDEFELAVSIVASLGVGALVDDQMVSCTTGSRAMPSHTPNKLLDTLAGVDLGPRRADLTVLTRRSMQTVRGASVVVLLAGSHATPAALRAAAEVFHRDVRVVGIRAVPGAALRAQVVGSTAVLDVGDLAELPRVVRTAVAR